MYLKKGQIWYFDMMIGVLIFMAALVYYFQADINFMEDDDILSDLDLEGGFITDALMGSGFPEMWNKASVLEIGITDDDRINETKLAYFTELDYNQTRSLLRTKYEYYLFFESSSGPLPLNSTHEGKGKPGVNSTNIIDDYDPNHFIKITRFVAYKSNPRRMVLYLWK
jgi:hypothetical protein